VKSLENNRISKGTKEGFLSRSSHQFKVNKISSRFWIILIINILLTISGIIFIIYRILINRDILLILTLISLFLICALNLIYLSLPLILPYSREIAKKTPVEKLGVGKKQIVLPTIKKPYQPKSKEKIEGAEYQSEEDKDLNIPSIPEPPKKKIVLSLDSPNLSSEVLARIKKIESEENKIVLVNCGRCNAVIPIPILKSIILESELPVVPVSYIHKNLQNEDQHCITIHVDHDFDIRRQRISDVVISLD